MHSVDFLTPSYIAKKCISRFSMTCPWKNYGMSSSLRFRSPGRTLNLPLKVAFLLLNAFKSWMNMSFLHEFFHMFFMQGSSLACFFLSCYSFIPLYFHSSILSSLHLQFLLKKDKGTTKSMLHDEIKLYE